MVDWLVHHPEYLSLICRFHGYAISNLYAHLRDQHSDINSKARNAIVAEYSRLDNGQPSNADLCYGRANTIPAIDGNTVHARLRVLGLWILDAELEVDPGPLEQGSQAWRCGQQAMVKCPAVHYFCVTDSEDEAIGIRVETRRPNCPLIDDIKEQWAYEGSSRKSCKKKPGWRGGQAQEDQLAQAGGMAGPLQREGSWRDLCLQSDAGAGR
jgi:hypothetical protein